MNLRLSFTVVALLAVGCVFADGLPDAADPTPASTNGWAFRPLCRPPLPPVKHDEWVRQPLDRFVLAKLENHGLEPAHEAGQRTLLRRVYFDLVGLPPTPEEMRAFLADTSPGAYERVVDRLLASPRYGERWARH